MKGVWHPLIISPQPPYPDFRGLPVIPEEPLFVYVKMAAGMYLEHYLDSKTIVFVSIFIPINKHLPCSQCPACLHVSHTYTIYKKKKTIAQRDKTALIKTLVRFLGSEANGLTVFKPCYDVNDGFVDLFGGCDADKCDNVTAVKTFK